MTAPEMLAIVMDWLHAANRADADTAVALVDADVEVTGARGTARGQNLVREWLGRAHLSMKPERFFQREGEIVAAVLAEWHDAPGGNVTQTAATHFRFSVNADGKITRIIREDDHAKALADAGLTDADAIV